MIRNRISRHTLGSVLVLFLSLGFMLWMYRDVFLSPNGYLFDLHGDGLANYFSFVWHITYDQMFGHFGGMHYPYGEHLPFVDCHPALASLLRYLHVLGIPVGVYGIGILNLLMLLSPVFCAWFLYRILIEYRVQHVSAAIGATGITILSSQVLLLQYGHYALSYAVCFPMGWYLLMKFEDAPLRIGRYLIIVINVLCWAFIHQYLAMLLLAYYTLVHGKQIAMRLGRNMSLREGFLRTSHVVLPGIIIYILTAVLDPHTGRIEMPFDPAHTASVYSVFVPNYSVTRPLFEVFFDLQPQTLQPWGRVGNYIGLPSILVLGYLLVLLPFRWRRGRSVPVIGAHRGLFVYVLASIVLLLFAMGWHFRFTGTALLDLIPLLKQFVGLGRFAWAFYYVICVMTIVILSTVSRVRLRNILVAAAAFCYALEGMHYHLAVSSRIVETPNLLDRNTPANAGLSDLAELVQAGRYQAIIPLPFYHKYVTPGTFAGSDDAIQWSMRLACFTGVPLMSAVLSRPAVAESRKIIHMFNPNQYVKPIRDDLPDERPFLVLFTGVTLNPLERRMLDAADTIGMWQQLVLLELPYASCFAYDHPSAIAEFEKRVNAFQHHRSGWYMEDTTIYFSHMDFDHLPSDQVYRGTGAWSGKIDSTHVIFVSEPLDAEHTYDLSFWYYNHLYDQVYNHLWVEERDQRDSLVKRVYHSPTSGQLSDGDWVWNRLTCRVSQDGHRIALSTNGEARYATVFYVDELMFRRADMEVLGTAGTMNGRVYLRNNELHARETTGE